jgi:hypothetical protein
VSSEDVVLLPEDVAALNEPMTRADWVRVFRIVEERSGISAAAFSKQVIEAIFVDTGNLRRARAEIAQELATCTPEEVETLRRALVKAREPKT